VVARERKRVERLGDYVGCYAMDDRIGCAAIVGAARQLSASDQSLNVDVHFVITHGEEIGMIGAVRAAQLLKPDVCVAIDTSPVTDDSPLALDARPVVWYREATYNSKPECDRVVALAQELGFGAQRVVYAGAASDAGRIKQYRLFETALTYSFGFAQRLDKNVRRRQNEQPRPKERSIESGYITASPRAARKYPSKGEWTKKDSSSTGFIENDSNKKIAHPTELRLY